MKTTATARVNRIAPTRGGVAAAAKQDERPWDRRWQTTPSHDSTGEWGPLLLLHYLRRVHLTGLGEAWPHTDVILLAWGHRVTSPLPTQTRSLQPPMCLCLWATVPCRGSFFRPYCGYKLIVIKTHPNMVWECELSLSCPQKQALKKNSWYCAICIIWVLCVYDLAIYILPVRFAFLVNKRLLTHFGF